MSTIIDGTTGITTDGLIITGPSNVELIKLETAKVSTSGTSIDFTGIPSWAKKITIMFNNVSLNSSSNYLIQLGDSGGIETTGYVSASSNSSAATSGLIIYAVSPATNTTGHIILTLVGSNLWISSHSVTVAFGGGSKTLSDTLDRVRITSTSGTDEFDNGSINILIEGSL
jgi:hypothetical protein